MSFENTVNAFAAFYRGATKRRSENWNDFREFHEWMINQIPQEMAKDIGTINGVSRAYPKWGIEFSAKDYAWWGLRSEADKLDVVSVSELKRMVTDKLVKIIDSSRSWEMTLDEAKDLVAAFDLSRSPTTNPS